MTLQMNRVILQERWDAIGYNVLHSSSRLESHHTEATEANGVWLIWLLNFDSSQ